jgi:hypothetical protein
MANIRRPNAFIALGRQDLSAIIPNLYFMTLWNILRPFDIILPFGIFCGNFIYFYPFGMLYQEKFGNPDSGESDFPQKKVT